MKKSSEDGEEVVLAAPPDWAESRVWMGGRVCEVGVCGIGWVGEVDGLERRAKSFGRGGMEGWVKVFEKSAESSGKLVFIIRLVGMLSI